MEPAKHPDIERVLIGEARLARRVTELGTALNADYSGRLLTLIILSSGGLVFGADLLRQLDLPMQLDTLSVSSYIGRRSSERVRFLSRLKVEVTHRDVLVVDDIFDSGLTLAAVSRRLARLQPASIRTCVLLAKRRSRTVSFVPDYVGFEIADHFVVGYGLDYNEAYRNLPYIAVLREQVPDGPDSVVAGP